MVGICKRIQLKAWETGQDSYLAIMLYRATPISANLKTPVEILNGRQIQTPLISKQQLDDVQTRQGIEQYKDKPKECYNKQKSRQHEKTRLWGPGIIQYPTVEPSSYIVESEESIHQLEVIQHLKLPIANVNTS